MIQATPPTAVSSVSPSRVHRKIVFSIFTIGIGMVLLLLLPEAILRTVRPDIAPRGTSADLVIEKRFDGSPGLRPGASGVTGNARVAVDALGFWKYDAAPDSSADGWLLLGDSVTMGIGIESDSTFAGRLAHASRNYRVLNASWIGYTIADYVNVARETLKKFNGIGSIRPVIKRVTVFWTLNDIYADCSIGMPPGQTVREQGGSMLPWLRRNYVTYLWLKDLFFDRSKDYYLFDRQFYREGDERLKAGIAKLDSLDRLCTDYSARLDVVLLPYEYQLRDKNAEVMLPQRLMASVLDSMKISWTDASAATEFAAASPKDFFLFGDGIHFSSAGHRAIFRFLSGSRSDH